MGVRRLSEVWNGKEEETLEPSGHTVRKVRVTPGLKKRSEVAVHKLKEDFKTIQASLSLENIKKSLTTTATAKP